MWSVYKLKPSHQPNHYSYAQAPSIAYHIILVVLYTKMVLSYEEKKLELGYTSMIYLAPALSLNNEDL